MEANFETFCILCKSLYIWYKHDANKALRFLEKVKADIPRKN